MIIEPINKSREGWPFSVDSTATEQNVPSGHLPKISVVTPSYNQGAFIEETIRSVIGQGYPNLEYILIDGGSTDESIDIIRHYESYFKYWVSEKDRGQSHAINKGLSMATGDIVTWLNSDDFYAPSALYTLSQNLSAGVGLYIGQGHKIDLDRKVVYSPKPRNPTFEGFLDWSNTNNFMQPAAFFTQDAWQQCGPLNEDLHFCMDVDLWLKISREFPVKEIDQSLAFAYEHPDAKTTADSLNMRIETLLLSASYGDWGVAKEGIEKLVRNSGKNSGFSGMVKQLRKILQGKRPLRNVERFY